MTQKKSPSKGRRSTSDRMKIMAAFLLLGGTWFYVKRSKNTEIASLPAKDSAPAPQIFQSPKQLAQDQSGSQQRSQLFIRERAAGLMALPVQRSEKGFFQLTVTSKAVERGCMQGDLDVMKEDLRLRKRKEPGFRLSLENLDPASSMKPVQIRVSTRDLKKGVNHTFQIPVTPERSFWGLFLCSSGGDSFCQRLSKNDIGKLGSLQDRIRDRAESPAAYPTDDKVFFFQFMVSYPDRLLLHHSSQSLDESFTRLNQVLDSTKDKAPSPALLNNVKTWLRSIGSLPATIHSTSVELQLPYRGEKCP